MTNLLVNNINNSNFYLNAIGKNATILDDKINLNTTTLDDKISINKSDIEYMQLNTKINDTGYYTNIIKPFNNDLVLYYDFSNPDDLGFDASLNGNNALVINNPIYANDITRTHCIDFQKLFGEDQYTNSALNTRCLKLDPTKLISADFTISCWFNSNTTINAYTTIFAIGGTNNNGKSEFSIGHNSGKIQILAWSNNILLVNFSKTQAANVWVHIAVSVSATNGNRIYVNGVLQTVYTTGSQAGNYDLRNTCTDFSLIGAMPFIDTVSGLDTFRMPFDGQISDFTFWNRILVQTEIDKLFVDDYGYAVFPLIGQSNMAGSVVGEAIDDDFTILNNRAWQFSSLTDTIKLVKGNLETFGGDYGATKTGLWKAFAEDVIRYAGFLPFRKRILFIPIARGGTSLQIHWKLGGTSYTETVIQINKITDTSIAANSFNVIAAILWNQGETDIANKFVGSAYKTAFNGMLTGFYTELLAFDNTIPFIVSNVSCGVYDSVYLADNSSVLQSFNDVMDSLAIEHTNIILADSHGCDFNAYGNVHYSPQGYRELGHRYYNAYCIVSNMKNMKPLNNENVVLNSTVNEKDVVFNVPVKFNQPYEIGYTNIALDTYISYTLTTLTYAGACNGSFTDIIFTRLGNLIFITLPNESFSITSTELTIYTLAIPIQFRPMKTSTHNLNTNYSGKKILELEISIGGVMTITDYGSLFTNGGGFITDGTTLNYIGV